MTEYDSVHRLLDAVSLRAHATAVGLVQLALELRRAGVLNDEAVDRIKEVMIEEICSTRPRTSTRSVFEADIRQRLNQIFAGKLEVGPAASNNET